jgi:hypothetical protein
MPTKIEVKKELEQLLVAARHYSSGDLKLSELRRAAVAFATAEWMHKFDKQCERIREMLGYQLGKVAANKIVSEIKAQDIRSGYGPYIGSLRGDTIQLGLGRHYLKFDRAGNLVERGVRDIALASTAA